jgi:hypothetical protein
MPPRRPKETLEADALLVGLLLWVLVANALLVQHIYKQEAGKTPMHHIPSLRILNPTYVFLNSRSNNAVSDVAR